MLRARTRRLAGISLAAAACAALAVAARPAGSPETARGDADRQAIAALVERHRTAWLAGDAATIRSLFVDDAAFLPHHGLPPVEGLVALSEF